MADVDARPTDLVSRKSSRLAVSKKTTAKSTKSVKSSVVKTGKSAKNTTSTKIPRVQKSGSDHPTYMKMVTDSIIALKDRRGASNQAILAHIRSQYNVSSSNKLVCANVSTALKKGVSTGTIVQVSGVGARGRFKMAKPAPKSASAPRTTSATTPKATTKKTTTGSTSTMTQSTSTTASAKSAQKSKKSVKKTSKAPSKKAVKPKKA